MVEIASLLEIYPLSLIGGTDGEATTAGGSDSGEGVEVGCLVGLGEVVGSFRSDVSVQPARRTRPVF